VSKIEKRCIRVGRVDELDGKQINIESNAGEEILPGTIVKHDIATDTIVKSDIAADDTRAPFWVADKDDLRWRDIETPWEAGSHMHAVHFRSGDIANVLVAVGETLAYGDPMVRNGEYLTKGAPGADDYIATCDEDYVTVAGDQLVRVRIA